MDGHQQTLVCAWIFFSHDIRIIVPSYAVGTGKRLTSTIQLCRK